MIFRVTHRARAFLGLPKSALSDVTLRDSLGVHEWYFSLYIVDRRKCLLCTHAPTLLSFVAAGVRKAQLAKFGAWFRQTAEEALLIERLTTEARAFLLPAESDCFAQASDRSLLGSMNDFGRMFQNIVYDVDNLAYARWERVRDSINESPMSYLGFRSPRQVMAALLEAELGEPRRDPRPAASTRSPN